MSDNRYIGVFDSGIGGLTVVKSIVECMPGEHIIYFGDTAHVPYGTRSKRQITEYVLADVRFLRTFIRIGKNFFYRLCADGTGSTAAGHAFDK